MAAKRNAPDEPARQQLVQAGVSESDLDTLERQHGLGAGLLSGLLAKFAPMIIQMIMEALSKANTAEPSIAPQAPKK
jgi:hypothetical protein